MKILSLLWTRLLKFFNPSQTTGFTPPQQAPDGKVKVADARDEDAKVARGYQMIIATDLLKKAQENAHVALKELVPPDAKEQEKQLRAMIKIDVTRPTYVYVLTFDQFIPGENFYKKDVSQLGERVHALISRNLFYTMPDVMIENLGVDINSLPNYQSSVMYDTRGVLPEKRYTIMCMLYQRDKNHYDIGICSFELKDNGMVYAKELYLGDSGGLGKAFVDDKNTPVYMLIGGTGGAEVRTDLSLVVYDLRGEQLTSHWEEEEGDGVGHVAPSATNEIRLVRQSIKLAIQARTNIETALTFFEHDAPADLLKQMNHARGIPVEKPDCALIMEFTHMVIEEDLPDLSVQLTPPAKTLASIKGYSRIVRYFPYNLKPELAPQGFFSSSSIDWASDYGMANSFAMVYLLYRAPERGENAYDICVVGYRTDRDQYFKIASSAMAYLGDAFEYGAELVDNPDSLLPLLLADLHIAGGIKPTVIKVDDKLLAEAIR